jgi:hypothetical protein
VNAASTDCAFVAFTGDEKFDVQRVFLDRLRQVEDCCAQGEFLARGHDRSADTPTAADIATRLPGPGMVRDAHPFAVMP